MNAENEEKLRKHRCCFTGHRPEKLHESETSVKEKLTKEIKKAIQDGYITFIVGMCRGVDLWAGEIIINEKAHNADIHLVCAIPHPDFEERWDDNDKFLYKKVLNGADIVKTISEHYFKACYQIRNEWMINKSSRIIAAFNGEKGGTKNSVEYAKRGNISIINILDIK